MLVTWMGEQIDEKGIGNGISMLIFAGIISRWSGLHHRVCRYCCCKAADQPLYYLSCL